MACDTPPGRPGSEMCDNREFERLSTAMAVYEL